MLESRVTFLPQFQGTLLSAALDGEHLKVVYDSLRSGVSERVIFPLGLHASAGYWYCACIDRKWGANVPIRADRFLAAERVEGYERPGHLPLERWLHGRGDEHEGRVRLLVRITARVAKSFELAALFSASRRAAERSWRRSRGGS
jgi:hypothetical protein